MSTLTLDGVTLAGRAGPRLDGVSLTLTSGRLTVVVGPNGAGKSSLLRVLAGLDGVDAGTVRWGDATSPARDALAATVAWLPQHPRPEEGLTAREVVAAARFRFHEPWRVACAAADRHLAALDADAWADRPMTTLSGGEAQRVRLASLAAQEAAWWLLDEPANHLDPAVRWTVREVVRRRAAEGGGVVLVTHDLGGLARLGEARVIVCDRGAVVHDGDVGDPALPGVLGTVFGVDIRAVDVDGAAHLVVAGPRP